MGRRIEGAGVLLLLAAFGFFLWRNHELIAWSDPGAWVHFGRHFSERFGATALAYGFPLVVSGAVALAGPIWAFLVNLPILVLFAGLLYAFSRSLAAREPGLPVGLSPVAGVVALALLLWIESEKLVGFVSPYRDPLSYVFVLLSCLCVLRYRSAPRQLLWMAGAGASLALACSTRETSGLMLVPFLLFGLASRRDVPLLRAVCVFGASFALFCIPMLVHNHGVSGRFWLPAQAASSFVEEGSLTPGVRPEHLSRTLPGALGYLWTHLGWPTLLLALLGVASAAYRRQREVLALVVPAFLIYLLFYGGYQRPVPRYLFVLDLFVLPSAGLGAAALLDGLLRPLGSGRAARGAASAVFAGVAAGGVFVCLDASREPAGGFRIADARALTHHIEALVADDRPILGERRIAEVLRCFVPNSERVRILRPRKVFAQPEVRERIREIVRGADEAYYVSLESSGGSWHTREPLTHFMRSEFDLELLASFRASTYGLPVGRDGLEEHTRFHLDRVTRWSRRETSRTLEARTPGPQLLEVHVGHLSSEDRESARVYWNDTLLDHEPRDGVNYYAVRVEDRGEGRVWLRSDGRVPSAMEARLRPLAAPLRMIFDAEGSMDHRSRLSDSFFESPGRRYPVLRDEGSMRVPTPDSADVVFVVVANIVPLGGPRSGMHELIVGTPAAPFYRLRFRDQSRTAPRRGRWHRISFAFDAAIVTGDETSLVWHYRAPSGDESPSGLALHGLTVYRHRLAPGLEVDVAADGGEPFLLDGFGDPESLPAPGRPALRPTGPRAELRIPIRPDPRPARLEVRYLTGLRPASAPAASPEFRWNDAPLVGTSREEPVGRFTRVTARFELPAALLGSVVNHLVIHSTPWQGRGILLERVTLERTGPA